LVATAVAEVTAGPGAPVVPQPITVKNEVATAPSTRRIVASLNAGQHIPVVRVQASKQHEDSLKPSPEQQDPARREGPSRDIYEDGRIFVWGNAPSIYVLSNRLPGTRFVGFLRGLHRSEGESPTAAWDAGPEVWPQLTADFARNQPALIVDTSSGDYREFGGYKMARFPAVQALVSAGYVLDGTIEGATLYRRRR
jgi:hypothetical protein